MTRVTAVLDAVHWAAHCHAGQTRKGAKKEPYVTHVIEVARRLAEVAPEDETLILAGLLHDVVEDTEATREDVVARFGEEVAAVVMEVTDDPDLPEPERKRKQVETAASKSERARRVKLADKTANLLALAESPPDWKPERLAKYLDWASAVVDQIRGTDARLEAEFDRIAALARQKIGEAR